MRISDWSSDVCSSDLRVGIAEASWWRTRAYRGPGVSDGDGLVVVVLGVEDPSLMYRVMVEPGSAAPDGAVAVAVPLALGLDVRETVTLNPAFCNRDVAADSVIPTTDRTRQRLNSSHE